MPSSAQGEFSSSVDVSEGVDGQMKMLEEGQALGTASKGNWKCAPVTEADACELCCGIADAFGCPYLCHHIAQVTTG